MIQSLLALLKNMADSIQHTFSSVPFVIIVLLIIALIVMILTIALVIWGMRRGSAKKQTAPASGANATDEESSDQDTDLPPIGVWISEFLSKKGFFQVSPLSLSFLKALDFLKQSLNSYNYKYQLPWYLLIGADGSGKTSFFENSELNMPALQPKFEGPNPNPDCRWWFLNKGVVLDAKGSLLIAKTGLKENQNAWRSLLVLLSRYRAARPLNGIILTVPADELYGRHKFNKDEIYARAQLLAAKMTTAQNSLGLRLPVYVLITKTDLIPGFQSFCAAIPTSNRNNMIGWSSPYTVTTAYTPSWVDEAFSSLESNLQHLKLELFADGHLGGHSGDLNDGLFVFPSELSTVKENLGIYLDCLFKDSAFQDSLLLRGLYFCGDSGMTPLKILDDSSLSEDAKDDGDHSSMAATLTGDMDNSTRKRKIFFLKDFLSEKVFYESGLAHPLKGKLLTANRALNSAKIGTICFALIGSIGLFSAYEKFSKNRDDIMPVLSKMGTSLKEMQTINLGQSGESIDLFNDYARQLINMMDQLQDTQFFSIFVPGSWFSPLQADLHKTLQIAYQQVIIRTIYIDLLLKARDLLHLRPTAHDQSTTITQLLQPTQSAEYVLLKRYIEGLATLQKKINTFENLRKSADPKDLNDLVLYTFKAELPPSFYVHYKKFRTALQKSPFPSIDLTPYNQLAKETLDILYQNFLNALFSKNPSSLPVHINTFIQSLGQQNSQQLPDITALRRFTAELAQARPSLGEAGKTWMDGEIFNPGGNQGKEFEDLLDLVDSSPLFGKTVTQTLVDRAAMGFASFKEYLQSLNLLLKNQQFSKPISAIPLPAAPSFPSDGIVLLEKSLTALFAEPYMAPVAPCSFATQLPKGKTIFWDDKLTQMAYDIGKRYDEFNTKELANFPPILQENMRLVARQNLQYTIIDLVSKAQNFVDLPFAMTEGLAAEEILRSKISDARDIAPKFIRLLEILNHDAVGDSFVELRNFLGTTTYWLLSQVEQMLQSLNPYAINDQTFAWWNGKMGAGMGAFSAKDIEDLKSYLAIQRQQVQNMALEFAKPLVSFLTADIMLDAQGDRDLLNRWKRIIDQAEAFNKKQPGNSMTALEDFILVTLNSYDVNKCLTSISQPEIQSKSGDYFLESIRLLKKGIRARAEILKRQQGIENYKNLVSLFNKNLKNNFPFVGTNISLSAAEADPESIWEFFKAYDKAGGNPKEILDQIHQLGPSTQEAMQFLQAMQDIKVFLGSYLKGDAPGDIPSFNFSMDFHVNRAKEKGGDLIVDWTFKPNSDIIIDKNDKLRNGTWVYGDPVEASFRWAEGDTIPAKPAKDPGQPLLTVEEGRATFRFPGRWSLLWLLRLQAARQNEYSPLKDPNPFMLKFSVPTEGSGRSLATVYNLITLTAPSSNPKSPGKVVRIPTAFPALAPTLSEEVLKYDGQAVLTEGVSSEEKSEDSEEADKPSSEKEPAREAAIPEPVIKEATANTQATAS
ncbi:MAG: hypothetical protein NTX76_02335 [Alphaproteobacteria bacterium]|nr:hypothetical protein [Alphaproteobacteria bacterium]